MCGRPPDSCAKIQKNLEDALFLSMLKSFILLFIFLITPAAITHASGEDSSANYVNDLNRFIKESRDSIRELNNKTKEEAMASSNKLNNAQAKSYYEKGLRLTEQGKFDEAREYFDNAVRVTKLLEEKQRLKKLEREKRDQEIEQKRLQAEQKRQEAEQKRQEWEKQKFLERQQQQEEETKRKQEAVQKRQEW